MNSNSTSAYHLKLISAYQLLQGMGFQPTISTSCVQNYSCIRMPFTTETEDFHNHFGLDFNTSNDQWFILQTVGETNEYHYFETIYEAVCVFIKMFNENTAHKIGEIEWSTLDETNSK